MLSGRLVHCHLFFMFAVEAAQELLWWSIFSKRLEMSTFLWRRTSNRVATALIAASLCRACEQYIESNETFHLSHFQHMRDIYDSYAIDLLSHGSSDRLQVGGMVRGHGKGLGQTLIRANIQLNKYALN